MKKLLKNAAIVAASLLLTVNFSSCNKDPQGNNEETNKAKKEAIVKQYLEHTVYPTYGSLATETDKLVGNLEALKANKTQANVNTATATFIEARHWWEMSEAFLFGAASDFGIDPHIDSWPLDEDAFNNLMGSPNMIAMLADDEDGTIAGEQLGNALLGFHGIEYILFREGQPRDVNEINDDMMTYVLAVSRDLRNRCFQLEVSWNENAPQTHKDLMEELELNTTVNSSDNTYGANMTHAGQAGSTYASFTNALEAIADGCLDIADEVGTSKIGKPHTGEDPTYVESPYSQKSIKDFYDNIISIKNAYMGGMENQRDETLSLHTYIKDYNADLDTKAMNAIDNALTKINAMKAPFVQFYADASAGEAMEACQDLSDVMAEVKAEFSKIDRK
ncbi:MAG: peptidase M75 [Bacteroidales bacterium]|nr:peptidase M75 [Bacteroidales bacterium]MBR6929469.1 peptidase M75 [Bacteroidales bacterium]